MEPLQFALQRFAVARQGNLLGARLHLAARNQPALGLELGLHRIDAVAQEAVKFFHRAVVVHLGHRDGLADAHRDGHALLVEDLVDQVGGTESRINLAYAMEVLGGHTLKVDGHHGAFRHPDKLDDGFRPRAVLDDAGIGGGAEFRRLIGSYRASREQPEASAVPEMLKGLPHSHQAAASAAQSVGKGVDGEHIVAHFRHGGKNIVAEGVQVGTNVTHDIEHHHAVNAAEMVVGQQDEGPFLRNIFELLDLQVVFDIQLFKNLGGKVKPLVSDALIVKFMGFIDTHGLHGARGNQPPDGAAHANGFLNIRFID